ncbi:MAG: hypothetical protein K9G46_06410 [Flavobacteriales bacterium]|nr:hypothetical protein [Flavobacteriales bacterium]
MIKGNSRSSAFIFGIGALFLFVLAACNTNKPVSVSEAVLLEGRYLGYITTEFAADGCPFILTYTDGSEEKYLIPVQLEEQYQRNGLQLEFGFHYSRIMQGDCQKGQPAVLEAVEVR